MKKIKSFDQFVNEGVMPEWAKPTSDLTSAIRKDNFQKHQDPNQSMTRFTVGDRVVEVETGVEGTITSMGDGMNTITWKCDRGERHDSYAQELGSVGAVVTNESESVNEATIVITKEMMEMLHKDGECDCSGHKLIYKK